MPETDEALIKQLLNELDDLRAAQTAIYLQKREAVDRVLAPEIKAALDDIDAEFDEKAKAATAKAAEVEAQLREMVIAHGKTVNSAHLQAVFTKPRVTWDNHMLEGMMAIIPQLREARKEGAPSVSFRSLDK